MLNKIRILSPWSQFSIFLGIAGASLILFYVLAGLIVEITGIGSQIGSDKALTDIHTIDVSKIVQVLFSVIVFGLTGYLYARVTFREGLLPELGLRRASRSIFYLIAIFLLIFSFPLEEWLGELNKRIPLAQWMVESEKANDLQVEAFLKIHHPIDPFINVVVMAAIPAFCEEVCFRGALQRIMIQICKRPLAGIVVSAFLFSFFHFQFEGFLPRMFLGMLLGAAYWYSGSLWVAIVAHFFFNGTQIVLAMYNPSVVSKSPSVPLLFVLVSLVIVVGLLSAMRSRSTTSYAGVYETQA
jgi:membrane protease YdiL (CAAX protease family)